MYCVAMNQAMYVPNECQILHSDTEGVAQDPEDELWAGFEYCGLIYRKSHNICIFEKHTADEGQVVYYGDTSVDEDEEYFAQNENVKRCEDVGCELD
jgi:hypothetical protein